MDAALEREIAGHLRGGELAAAATAALNGLGPQILGFLASTLRDEDAANDVFGAFCEELWKSIGTFRGDSSFKTWAYKIVMHSVGRYHRDGFRKRARALGSSEASVLAEQIRSRTSPYRRTDVKDQFAQLREALEPDEQVLLFLRVDQGLSWTDVAAVVAARGDAVEVAALRKRFERAKARLRKLAQDAGLLDR